MRSLMAAERSGATDYSRCSRSRGRPCAARNRHSAVTGSSSACRKREVLQRENLWACGQVFVHEICNEMNCSLSTNARRHPSGLPPLSLFRKMYILHSPFSLHNYHCKLARFFPQFRASLIVASRFDPEVKSLSFYPRVAFHPHPHFTHT